jgi:hypothetical protein
MQKMKKRSLLLAILSFMTFAAAFTPLAHAQDHYFWGGCPQFIPFDNDGDGYNDAVEVEYLYVATYDGTLNVTVVGHLKSPLGLTISTDSQTYEITGPNIPNEVPHLFLYVPSGGQVSEEYDAEFYLYDEADVLWDTLSCIDIDGRLFPPGYDVYFDSVDYIPFDTDSDGYNDALEAKMNADTTDGTQDVAVMGYFYWHETGRQMDDVKIAGWEITGNDIEYVSLYFYVPESGHPEYGEEGWYDVWLGLSDELVEGPIWKDEHFDEKVAYLYPRGYLPSPACQVSPTSLDFGIVTVGNYHDKTFTITNTGGGTLAGSVSESCNHYSIVSGGGAYSLGAGQSRIVTVRFAPTATGTHTCTIETGTALCNDVSCIGVGEEEAPPPPVGGIWVPVDKLGLLAPYIGLGSTLIVATVATAIYAKRAKHRKKKQ